MKNRVKSIYRYCLFLSSFILSLFSFSTSIFAQTGDGANAVGHVYRTPGIARFSPADGDIGLLTFISMLIKLGTIIAGIWALFNFIFAGYTYITSSGDSGAHTKVKDKITMSVLGLALIVATYTIIGVIGLIFFGDAGYILNPVVLGPQ